MAYRLIDDSTGTGDWTARKQDGTDSNQIVIQTAPRRLRDGGAGTRLTITASAASRNHFAEKAIPATDLTAFTELQLWMNANRTADGKDENPFYLKLQLGSAGVAPGAAQNSWFRYLPVTLPGEWQCVRMGLTDLPDAIRKSVTALRLTNLDGGPGWVAAFDGLHAVREQMLVDVPDALRALLAGTIIIENKPVPAELVTAGPPLAGPATLVKLLSVEPLEGEYRTTEYRSDYTDKHFLVWPPAEVYILRFSIDAAAAKPSDRSLLLDSAFQLVSSRRALRVHGADYPMQLVAPGVLPDGTNIINLEIRAWKASRNPAQPVRTIRELALSTGQPERKARS